ncbi:hypothetical protein NM213_14235 [Pseudomonas lactis]|uniref:Uncharacterized protein n=2 Tax=Pseudomonas TaxID=286 RepID=A0ABS9FLD6_9PSED|nr:hypothetical protein [Pseudomonas lactis]MBI6977726.1 hypothetical protein [Pseudomonas lactis]MCF4974241.1 hypothetical protein [Pseudomonas lactis]MCF5001713.1 hypothetical protein [Pseudomonas lactis]MCF5005843.1 hypothetical protein [Pseudomonas lactis]MCF5012620.1 hypothetical protein [Pseudomonas lactis]
MDIFLPDPATNLPGSTLPDASITPVNPDGTLNNHDIENKLAYMHVFPYAGIQLEDEVACSQKVEGGTWFSFRKVTNPCATIDVLVRSLRGGTTTTISYYVRRGGEIVGRSGERVYHVV